MNVPVAIATPFSENSKSLTTTGMNSMMWNIPEMGRKSNPHPFRRVTSKLPS